MEILNDGTLQVILEDAARRGKVREKVFLDLHPLGAIST